MAKTATLNLRVNPDLKENADEMTSAQLHAKLDKGYEDIEKGNVVNAAEAFAKFRETH